MKFLWAFILLILVAISIYLLFSLSDFNKSDQEFDPSPKVRIQLKDKLEEVTLRTKSDGFKIWMEGADRPIHKKGNSIIVTYQMGKFYFAGLQQKAGWMDIIPNDNYFYIEGGEYPGMVRLIPEAKQTSMMLINILELEPYIARVLEGEMNRKWPMETLKAQAIAARTYALHHIITRSGKDFDMYDSSRSQAYKRTPPGKRCIEAVRETEHFVLEYQNKPIVAYYINTCGGATVPVELVNPYTRPIPPLKGVQCKYCTASPHYLWEYKMDKNLLALLLTGGTQKDSALTRIEVFKKHPFRNNAITFKLRGKKNATLSAIKFRRIINRYAKKEVLKSLNFDLKTDKEDIVIIGKGWGHIGLGLCQYGAKKMGESHFSFDEILSYYYPSSSLVRYKVEGGELSFNRVTPAIK